MILRRTIKPEKPKPKLISMKGKKKMKKYYTNKKWGRAFAGTAIAATFVLGLTACTDTKPTEDKVAVEAVTVDNSAADIVQTVYDGFAAGDMNMVTSVMSPDIIWNEAEGNPYADKNPYVGPDEILSGVFSRIGGDWTNFTATPSEFVTQGNRVVVFGRYAGTYNATGKTLDAPFVHSLTITDGKITGFQQYMDTEQQVAVMTK